MAARRAIWAVGAVLLVLGAGHVVPERPVIPVEGASRSDWHPRSFWFEPWGRSGVHKGIDIFAPHGRPVRSAVPGLRLFQGEWRAGGHVVAVLGPKWRIHCYSHLAQPANAPFFVAAGTPIGAVGSSGNAAGKPPHLHYSVLSLVPAPWRFSTATQGWKKMFFVDPGKLLTGA